MNCLDVPLLRWGENMDLMPNDEIVKFNIALQNWEDWAVRHVLRDALPRAEASFAYQQSLVIAKTLHRGRMREDGVTKYMAHCHRVRNNAIGIIASRQVSGFMPEIRQLSNPDYLTTVLCAAVLHDNWEDAKDRIAEIKAIAEIDQPFGSPVKKANPIMISFTGLPTRQDV